MDLVFSSTAQLAAAIRAGRVSAVDVLAAHLAQIDRYNPALNAIITLDAEHAYERARQADESLVRGEVWGPLHGVPFTLKDATRRRHAHDYWVPTSGSHPWRG